VQADHATVADKSAKKKKVALLHIAVTLWNGVMKKKMLLVSHAV
jgi:hypothetical protein